MIKLETRRILFTLVAIVLFFAFIPSASTTSYAMTKHSAANTFTNLQISLRSMVIDYRYKIVDGKVYRRLFNYTTQQWVGDWELCP